MANDSVKRSANYAISQDYEGDDGGKLTVPIMSNLSY